MIVPTVCTLRTHKDDSENCTPQNMITSNIYILLLLLLNKNAVASSSMFVGTRCTHCTHKCSVVVV